MKKILAVAMALTMLFALCVPAFAGTITQGTPDPKEAVVPVKTTYSTSQNYNRKRRKCRELYRFLSPDDGSSVGHLGRRYKRGI